MMRQKFEEDSLKEQAAVSGGKNVRKQIVSMQFSSNVSEIDSKNGTNGSRTQ